jgi:hypothetical protein
MVSLALRSFFDPATSRFASKGKTRVYRARFFPLLLLVATAGWPKNLQIALIEPIFQNPSGAA